jgi:DNA-directed RNA polymerase omega subunit
MPHQPPETGTVPDDKVRQEGACMFKISTEKLLRNSGGRYRLLETAFQRTHQLNNGMPPTIKASSKKNAMIALQEIAEGKVRVAKDEEEPEAAE